MNKTRKRIPKTVRVLPAIEQLVREIATLEADYRFLTESEVLEAATQLGALVLAAQIYGRGEVLEAISREELFGRLKLDLAAVWAMLPPSGSGFPPSAGNVSAQTPMPTAAPIAREAASIVSSFGGAFLSDDD